MTEAITEFEGDNFFLSNFYMYPVYYPMRDGILYPSNEHAYQAAKTTDRGKQQEISILPTPAKAKKAGRALKIRPDWEQEKLAVMETLLWIKFCDPYLRQRLIKTGEAQLVEGNWWGDTFWGVCKGVGENHLGRLLMKLRDRFKVFEEIRELEEKLGFTKKISARNLKLLNEYWEDVKSIMVSEHQIEPSQADELVRCRRRELEYHDITILVAHDEPEMWAKSIALQCNRLKRSILRPTENVAVDEKDFSPKDVEDIDETTT